MVYHAIQAASFSVANGGLPVKEVMGISNRFGFDYEGHDGWFALVRQGSPTIRGDVEEGRAANVRIDFESAPEDMLTPEETVSYAEAVMESAFVAKAVEGALID